MDAQIRRLSELNRVTTRSGNSAVSAPSGFGRYSRRPDYTSPSVKGSRPTSGRGVTFHFKHTYVSKKNSVASGYQNETSASAHQDYIERKGVCETVADADGTEREISFGTLGETKAERSEFWRKVERSEGRKARVQCRMIVELPHELDGQQREALARDFCRTLEENGLPYHCAVHAPDRKNDPRNNHMHIAYFDRPSRRMEDGRWDFEITERVRGKNRIERIRRPYKQNKNRASQGAQWVTHLRRQYADVANAYLAVSGNEKRYDPRAYKDSGIAKEPTLHLGTKRAHAESQGLDTKAGRINAGREISFQLSSAESHFHQQRARMKLHADGLLRAAKSAPAARDMIEEVAGLCEQHAELSREGLGVAKKRAVHRIASETVTGRLDKRMSYLKKEADKLVVAPPRDREAAAMGVSKSLYEEYDAAAEARSDLSPFATECQRIASAQTRRLDGISREQRELEKQIHAREKRLVQALGSAAQGIDADDLVAAAEMARDIRMAASDKPSTTDSKADRSRVMTSASDLDDLTPEALMPQPAHPSDTRRREQEDGNQKADSPDAGQAIPPDPLVGLFQRLRRSRDEAKDDASDVFDEQRMLAAERPKASQDDALPDAIAISPEASAEDIAALERRLAKVSNRDLRRHAFATRDRADLSEEDRTRRTYSAGLNLIERHAQRRGLDLNSGVHAPEKATDPRMARVHTDSVDPMSRTRWWDPNVRVRS